MRVNDADPPPIPDDANSAMMIVDHRYPIRKGR